MPFNMPRSCRTCGRDAYEEPVEPPNKGHSTNEISTPIQCDASLHKFGSLMVIAFQNLTSKSINKLTLHQCEGICFLDHASGARFEIGTHQCPGCGSASFL